MTQPVVDFELGASVSDSFSDVYHLINRKMMGSSETFSSRNGDTKELLNFKTQILKPEYRCVGGANRDINIFFLLAEALWIWSGRRDVDFLAIFNERMRDYSDDGVHFHAPYGWRLRRYNLDSRTLLTDSNKHVLSEGIDQVQLAIKLLVEEPETRRAVMSIWNPNLDLGTKSKDLPCNDLVMLQEREAKIHMTVANRSNDLHWGLPTNVFQFSWILELICLVVEKGIGTQTHLSKSLHLYVDNPIAQSMLDAGTSADIYRLSHPSRIAMAFSTGDPLQRLKELDASVDLIIRSLTALWSKGSPLRTADIPSGYLYWVCRLLSVYVEYVKDRNDAARLKALREIEEIGQSGMINDYVTLAKNWFFRRLKSPDLQLSARQEFMLPEYIGTL